MIGGISEKSYSIIVSYLKQFKEIKDVKLFGSRSFGKQRTGSDIDLVFYGDEINHQMVLNLASELNEKLPIPYKIDIVHYNSQLNPQLKQHIDQFAIPFISVR